jgi:hypothetical protein
LRQENISLSLIQAGSVPASDKLRSFISVVDSGQNNYLHLFHEFVARRTSIRLVSKLFQS